MTLAEERRCCIGCGVPLQTTAPGRAGYVPPQALAREGIICQRCFRIRHYNEPRPTERNAADFQAILERIGETDCLVVYIVDVFDIEGSLIRGLSRHVGANPILLVANKIDLLPKASNRGRLLSSLSGRLQEWGIQPVDIVLCSVKENISLERVLEKIDHYRRGRDVYLVGATNVGKSSLLNRLLHDYGDGAGDDITTSVYPGTTLDVIRIPLEGDSEIVDTPGIVNEDRLSERVSPDDLRAIIPRTRLNPRVYQLNDGQTLFLAGLARFDFKRGARQPFICYVANDLKVHRTKTENADALYAKHAGGFLAPPSDTAALPTFVIRSFRIAGEKTDIVISGLGWVTCRGDVADIDIYAPKGIGVSLRPAIV